MSDGFYNRVILPNLDELTESLRVDTIQQTLLQKKLITQADDQVLRAIRTQRERAAHFLNDLLPHWGNDDYETFCDILVKSAADCPPHRQLVTLLGLSLQTLGKQQVITRSTPVVELIGSPPSQCIVEMCKLLDPDDDMEDDWRRLWKTLLSRPLDEGVVRRKEEGPTHFLLKQWCRMTPPAEATVEHLMTALTNAYRNDVSRKLEEYCKKVPADALKQNGRHMQEVSPSSPAVQLAGNSSSTPCKAPEPVQQVEAKMARQEPQYSEDVTRIAGRLRNAAKNGKLSGFKDEFTDIPVDVFDAVCHIAAPAPFPFGDQLGISEDDILVKAKTAVPYEIVRHILGVWMGKNNRKATLEWLCHALEKRELLGRLDMKLEHKDPTLQLST